MKATTIPTNQEVYQRLLDVLPQLSKPLIEILDYDYKHLQEFEGNIKEFVRDRIDVIEECCRLINRDAVRIAFCGYFSSGKTSLINKLLGSNTFRVTAGEESGVSCFIMKGESDKFFLSYFSENKNRPEVREVSYEDFKRKTSMSELGDGQFDTISSAQVVINNPHIPSNVTWIDTAGLTTQNNESKLNRLKDAVAKADVIVWLCKSGGSGGFLTQDEQNFLKGLINDSFFNPILLINNINIEVNDWKDWVETTEEEIKMTIQKDEKYFVPNTFAYNAWQKLYTEDVLANKIQMVEQVFKEFTPIVPTIEELEKLYKDPNSEISKAILDFIHSKKPAHIQLHSFSTFKKCIFIENELSFEHFRKQLNQLNHKEHALVYNSRIAKIKLTASRLKNSLISKHTKWVNEVLKAKEESSIIIEKDVQNEINNIIKKHFEKAITQLENYKKEAVAKFEQTHQKLKEKFNADINYYNDRKISVTGWNNFTEYLYEKYHYYFDEERINDDKGKILTKKMESDYREITEKMFEKLIGDIYVEVFRQYFLHLVENTGWFDNLFNDKLIEFVEEKDYGYINLLYKPISNNITLGLHYDTIGFWNYVVSTNNGQNKDLNFLNINKSMEKTKTNITNAYDNYVKYLKNLKKCKIEEDKTAFLNIFKEEYLREYYQIKEMLEESIDKSSKLFSELQLHSIVRP